MPTAEELKNHTVTLKDIAGKVKSTGH